MGGKPHVKALSDYPERILADFEFDGILLADIKRQGHVDNDVLLLALNCIRDMVRKDKRQIGAHLVGQQA